VPAYTAAQQPLLTQLSGFAYNPRIMESAERTAKLDVTWTTPDTVPYLARIKAGISLRDNVRNNWDPNVNNKDGYTIKAAVGTFGAPDYVPAVVLPTAIRTYRFIGCQDTAGSLAPGGNACRFGYLPSADPRHALDGTATMTVQQFQALVSQTLKGRATPTAFFSGANGRPAGLLSNWTALDVDKVVALVGAPDMAFDCVKSCLASDGNVYGQQYQGLAERIAAFYLMGDFKVDELPFGHGPLPFGWEITGNIGYRYVRNSVRGTGMMTLTTITPVAGVYDRLQPTAPGGTLVNAVTKAVTLHDVSHDFLPSYNLATWLSPDQLVARHGWGKTSARPPLTYLLPAGNCTYDATLAEREPAAIQTCTGTLGNPALQGQSNINQDLSFEWYPNKDTLFTVAAFRQRGKIGAANARGVTGMPIAGGSGLVDPVTDVGLSNVAYNYSLWQNDVTTTRHGLELGTKVAFTFLPWRLRHTGFDANYTKLRSRASQNIVDLLTGAALPPVRESKYSYNYALWYDDGRLSARVAVQAVASYFNCIAGCTAADNGDYPAAGITSALIRFPYNPGSPNFKDATRFVDAKLSYKWRPALEVFVEGRNLGNATTSNSQGAFAPFADGTPNLLDYAYAGRRIMVGLIFRSL
jgi:TonB-dependent receptor